MLQRAGAIIFMGALATSACQAAPMHGPIAVNVNTVRQLHQYQAKRAKRPAYGEIHQSMQARLDSIVPAPPSATQRLPGLVGEKMVHMESTQEKGTKFLGLVHLTTDGPEALGWCRPNEWSGLQTTIPNGSPGRVVGVPFSHF
jgi:hypothetical protein